MTRSTILARMSGDDRMLGRALIVLYERQTHQERRTGQARRRNGVGFNAVDGRPLSEMARQLLGGGNLSKTQLGLLRDPTGSLYLGKYAGQLARLTS